MTMSQALWLTRKGRAELQSADLRQVCEDELLVESLYGAISRGTERLVAEGCVPIGEQQAMRAPLQDGEFPFPVKYGYAVVGRVREETGSMAGKTVFCLHPHQDIFITPTQMAIAVPDGVPAARAVLAANMETALNGIWDARVLPGDRVAVVGGGLVGLLVSYLAAKIPATQVTLVDINPARAALAAAFDCRFALVEGAKNTASESDIVIHTSGVSEGLVSAIALAGFEARIVEMSWYGDGTSSIPLGGRFHSQRLSIVGSQVGHVPASHRARWPLSRRLATALDLLRDDRLDMLISGETAFDELAGHYMDILSDPDTLCHRIRYR